MEVKFINFNGIKEYARVMYNDVEDSDKYEIEVAYNGKDIKDLLDYLFNLEVRIDKAIEYIKKNSYGWNTKYYDDDFNANELLEILGEKK